MPLQELSQDAAPGPAEKTFHDQPGGPESWVPQELAAALDAVYAPVWVLDLGGRCVFINQAATRMTGYSQEESIGQYVHCRIHKCHTGGLLCPESECSLQPCLQTGTGAHVKDEVCWRRDGSSFAADYSIQPLTIAGHLKGAVVTMADITERKRAVEKSLLDEEWFTVTTNAAGVGVCYREAGHTVASEQQFHLYGLEAHREWLKREEWLGLVHPDDRERVAEEQERATRQERPHQIEFRVIWPDGSVHWLFSEGRVLLDDDGNPVRRVEITVDITERRQAEGAFREFFTMSPSPLAIWGFDGRIRLRNPAWERILGFSQEEALDRTVMDYVHPQDRAAAAAAFEKVIRTGREMGLECRCECKDGSYRWLMVNGSASKEARVIYGTAQDITDRKRAEEALRKSEEWLKSAQAAAGVGVWDWDGESRETRVSDSQSRLYGLDPAQPFPSGDEFLKLIHPDDRERLTRELQLAHAGEAPYQSQFRVMWPDGSVHWLSGSGHVFFSDAGKPSRFIGANVDITDRVRAEKAFEEFFNLCPSTLAVVGFDGIIKRANPALLAIAGYTLEELRQKPFLEFIHPDDRALVAATVAELAARGKSPSVEMRGLAKDGSFRWLLAEMAPAKEENSIYISAIDIHARKLADEALEESERRFKLIAETIEEFFWIADDDLTEIIYASPAYEQVWGRSLASLYADPRSFLEAVHPDDRERTAEYIWSHVSQREPMDHEYRIVRRDGSVRWIWSHAFRAPSTEGRGGRYVGIAQDITGRKQTEETLREIQQRVRLIAETIDEVFWMSDVSIGRILYISSAYQRIWGRPCEELYADPKAFLSAVHPDDRARVVATLEIQKQGLPFDHEYRIRRADGSIAWIWDRGFPIPKDDGTVQFYTGVAQDISGRKGMEEALRLHAEKLAQSNAELERFAYVASHDLQEPLRMVASFTKLLSDRYTGKLDETADRYIHFAVDGAKRMQQLIADLLAYSRVDNKDLDLRATECEIVVLGAVENLQAAINESGASLEWDPLPTLVADPRQLAQLFQNLLGNAIKFRGESAPRVRISAADEGRNWRFSVRDNGIGIDPRQADRIFQVFQRLHGREEYPGSGIGLAICKKVVERHGGRIWVESEPGAGSDFRFTLPKRAPDGGADESS
jgi:PAS domain S-box-containing protein